MLQLLGVLSLAFTQAPASKSLLYLPKVWPVLMHTCLPAARLRHHSQAEAFEAWCAFVEERQLSLQRLDTALGHWNRATLTAAWSAWQEYVQEVQQRQEVLSRAVQHFMNRAVAAAFGQWREVAKRKAANASKANVCLQVLCAKAVHGIRCFACLVH